MSRSRSTATFVVGVLLGLWLSWAAPVVAQGVSRMFGTSASGVAVPIQADSLGRLKVVCQ